MNFYRPFHYFFGEYVFEVSKADFPRLANLLSQERIGFWKSNAIEDSISFRSSIFLAEDIVKTASESHIQIKITEKRGLPFLFSRYRRRYGLMLGAALGIFLMFYSQLFVWKISVSGNKTLTATEVERELEKCGITVGSFIPHIDVARDSNRLLIGCQDISSCAISINGTHLSVSMLEKNHIPDIVNTHGFYNVVALSDGVIMDIDAADGTPEVGEGDTVFEGELLINSFIEGSNGAFRPTHARGIVYAAVEESFVSRVPLSRVAKHYTGKSETKTELYVLGQKMPSLSSTDAPYEYFDAVSSEKTVMLFGFIELPVKVFRVTYSEYIPQTRTITPERAKLYAQGELESFLQQLDCEVISCDSRFEADEKNGICTLYANAVVRRNIAKEVPFDLDYYNISERLPKALE